jgi:hypothetical protein
VRALVRCPTSPCAHNHTDSLLHASVRFSPVYFTPFASTDFFQFSIAGDVISLFPPRRPSPPRADPRRPAPPHTAPRTRDPPGAAARRRSAPCIESLHCRADSLRTLKSVFYGPGGCFEYCETRGKPGRRKSEGREEDRGLGYVRALPRTPPLSPALSALSAFAVTPSMGNGSKLLASRSRVARFSIRMQIRRDHCEMGIPEDAHLNSFWVPIVAPFKRPYDYRRCIPNCAFPLCFFTLACPTIHRITSL